MKPKVIIIGGPTASGKSNLALELAQEIDGEIISCDSMQVYMEMDIGTAKPTKEDMQKVKHYMIDIVKPNESFNVVQYINMVKPIIQDVLKRNKVPILVGGTGLYVESLINNIEFVESENDYEYRKELEEFSKENGNEMLYDKLLSIDPEFANSIHVNDTKRIIRGLEVYHKTGNTMTYYNKKSREKESPYTFYLFGIIEDREKLYERINKRIDIMLEVGLIQEVENIYKKYNDFPTAIQGLGYKEVVSYLNNEYSYEEMVEKLKMETRRYAKRQLTWFRRYKDMVWLDKEKMTTEDMIKQIKDIVEK